MCGITGFLDKRPRPGTDNAAMRAVVATMASTLTHRGPDAGDTWAEPEAGIALGHRRLSIQDLSAAGAQPMASRDGRYTVVFNGEIYNFRTLSRELHGLGHHFDGHSDTEVMLAAFCQWGIQGALRRLQGMFAFAAWDQQEKALVLARDRVGKKPLYYGWCGDSFLFGSELKALRAHPGFNAEVDRDALALYLQHAWVPGPRSIFQGIQKLPAGHFLVVRADGQLVSDSYWSATDVARKGEAQAFRGALDDATNELQALLEDAVAKRMIADVSLGALLSGGFDSTTVTALMQAASNHPVKTFTIGFEEERYDESDHARAIASHLGTEHTELTVSPQDARDLIPDLPNIYDEPFADPSQMPTYIVSRLAREQVTVALSGDGGDELFAGYGRYRRPARDLSRWSALPQPLRSPLAGFLQGGANQAWRLLQPRHDNGELPKWRRAPGKLDKNVQALLAADPVSLFALQRARIPDGAALVPGAQPGLQLEGLAAAKALGEPMQGMMLYDFKNYLVDDILVKVDRASMAVSLEVRAPFLDHRIVEFAWRLPLRLRYGPGGGKVVMRNLLKRYVPPSLTERPKKGFGVPIGDWMRGPLRDWAEELLSERKVREQGLLRPEAVSTLWRQHLCGWKDHSDVLWSVLMFQAWLEQGGART